MTSLETEEMILQWPKLPKGLTQEKDTRQWTGMAGTMRGSHDLRLGEEAETELGLAIRMRITQTLLSGSHRPVP